MKVVMLGRRRSGKTWLYRRLIDGLNPDKLNEGVYEADFKGACERRIGRAPSSDAVHCDAAPLLRSAPGQSGDA